MLLLTLGADEVAKVRAAVRFGLLPLLLTTLRGGEEVGPPRTFLCGEGDRLSIFEIRLSGVYFSAHASQNRICSASALFGVSAELPGISEVIWTF